MEFPSRLGKRGVTVLAILALAQLMCCGASSLELRDILASIDRMPEFYTGACSSERSSYRDLLRTAFEISPACARWIVDSGLFMEDHALSSREVAFVEEILPGYSDPLRVVVTEGVLGGIARNETPRETRFDLGDDLRTLPTASSGRGSGEATPDSILEAMIQRIATDDPEVYEIRKGLYLIDEYGRPKPWRFPFVPPSHNTQLEVLCWILADVPITEEYWPLAIAAALAYGSVVTIADDQADIAIREYVAEMVAFHMDCDQNAALSALGLDIRSYPIEACIGLVWGASGTQYPFHNDLSPVYWPGGLPSREMTLEEFNWLFVDVEDLSSMQEWLVGRGFLSDSLTDAAIDMRRFLLGSMKHSYDDVIDRVLADINDYIYFGEGHITGDPRQVLSVHGHSVFSGCICNPSFQWDHFMATSEFYGTCGEDTTVENMLAKSLGVASFYGGIHAEERTEGRISHVWGHTLIHYYNPADGVLRTTPCQAFFYETTGWEDSPPISHDTQILIPWQNFAWPLCSRKLSKRGEDIEHTLFARGYPPGYIFRAGFAPVHCD